MEILSRRQAIPFDCLVGSKGGMRHKGERKKIKKITLSANAFNCVFI